MATIKELRVRIKSLKNTSKITSAMKMVSAAKLKKSQDAFTRTRPYYEKLQEMLERVSASFADIEHPLMKTREARLSRFYLISSDRGLAGSFNNNLLKYFSRQQAPSPLTEIGGLGRRARDFLVRNRYPLLPDHEALTNTPTLVNANQIAAQAIRDFLEGSVDRVFLVFNIFNSVLSQTPGIVQLLPFERDKRNERNKGNEEAKKTEIAGSPFIANYILEPNPEELLDALLPKLVTVQVFRSLLENAVGEHSARMTAMDNATKNTRDLISSLTLSMNRARQAAITTELTEIVSGAEALKK